MKTFKFNDVSGYFVTRIFYWLFVLFEEETNHNRKYKENANVFYVLDFDFSN